jgi:hypothetical protein
VARWRRATRWSRTLTEETGASDGRGWNSSYLTSRPSARPRSFSAVRGNGFLMGRGAPPLGSEEDLLPPVVPAGAGNSSSSPPFVAAVG